MRTTALLSLALLAACASTEDHHEHQAGAAPDHDAAPSARTLAQFESLKGLSGDWYQPDGSGAPEGEVVLNYRVSSGGSAVIETVFPGQQHEMVTAYTLDGPALVLTHYCALGNAPRMRAVEEGDAGEVHFVCAGVGNAPDHDALHMHDAVFRFEDDGRLHSVWTVWGEGALGGSQNFDLVRG